MKYMACISFYVMHFVILSSDDWKHDGVESSDALPVHLSEAVVELGDAVVVDVQGPRGGVFGGDVGDGFGAASVGKEPSGINFANRLRMLGICERKP